jgi:hypothetical protein
VSGCRFSAGSISRSCGTAAAVLAVLSAGGCRFLAKGSPEREAQWTAMIADLQVAKERGDSVELWLRRQKEPFLFQAVQTYDEALGRLYVERSISKVGHAPFESVTVDAFRSLFGGWRRSTSLVVIPALLLGPLFDTVLLPVQLISRPLNHWRVKSEDLRSALEDLARARRLGYLAERPPEKHGFLLDVLGYRLPEVGDASAVHTRGGPGASN